MNRYFFHPLFIAFMFALTLVGCSSQHKASYQSYFQSYTEVQKPFLEALPMNYLFPQMPYTVGVLKKDGTIVQHEKIKNNAVRLENGTWTIRGNTLELHYKTFNGYCCETPEETAKNQISKPQKIYLKLGDKGHVMGLRTFNESKVGFDQLYYNSDVIHDAHEYFNQK